MAKKTKTKVEMVDPVVEIQVAPVAPPAEVEDPIVPLHAVATKCLPGMRETWWKGIEAFAKLHGLNVEGAKLSECLSLLHA